VGFAAGEGVWFWGWGEAGVRFALFGEGGGGGGAVYVDVVVGGGEEGEADAIGDVGAGVVESEEGGFDGEGCGVLC